MNSENRVPLVIYHKDCFDGFTAAWVARHFLGPLDYFPAAYGADPPSDELLRHRQVYMIDFAYPRAVMKRLILLTRSTVVLDHHKTAEAALVGLLDELQQIDQRQPGDEIVFDMARSGAGIAWDYFSRDSGARCFDCGCMGGHQPGCPRGARPWLVDYIEDRDLWRTPPLPDGPAISAWIAAQEMTFGAWDALLSAGKDAAITSGRAVEAYIAQYGRKARAETRLESLGGHRVPVMNLPYMNCSEHVGGLADEFPDAPFAAGYFRRRDGKWQFSLRSRHGFDVSEVAKQFGGGGHAGAAGFETATLPWEQKC
jgi:hypothetical protein